MKRHSSLFITGLMLSGFLFLCAGGYVQAKAWLAHTLIKLSWHHNYERGVQGKAWFYADGYPVAKLEIEKLGISQVILSEASMRNLAFAPGFWRSGNSNIDVIAGHNDTHFSFIESLKLKDTAVLTHLNGQVKHFQVTQIIRVQQQDLSHIVDLSDALVLVTCSPKNKLDIDTQYRKIVILQYI